MRSSIALSVAIVVSKALAGLATPLEGSSLTRRVVYNCTDSDNQGLADWAHQFAQQEASYAVQIISNTAYSNVRTEYFGTASTAWPIWIYNQIAQESGTNYTLICEPGSSVCGSSTLAHTTWADTVTTHPDGTQTVSNYKAKTELCPAFYNLGDFVQQCYSDDAALGDTLLYHMAFALGRATTSIGVNNCDAARALALSDPTAATHSAENLRCFAHDAWRLGPDSICNAWDGK